MSISSSTVSFIPFSDFLFLCWPIHCLNRTSSTHCHIVSWESFLILIRTPSILTLPTDWSHNALNKEAVRTSAMVEGWIFGSSGDSRAFNVSSKLSAYVIGVVDHFDCCYLWRVSFKSLITEAVFIPRTLPSVMVHQTSTLVCNNQQPQPSDRRYNIQNK